MIPDSKDRWDTKTRESARRSEIRTPGRTSLCEEHAPDNDEAGREQGQAKVKSLQRQDPRTESSCRRQLPRPSAHAVCTCTLCVAAALLCLLAETIVACPEFIRRKLRALCYTHLPRSFSLSLRSSLVSLLSFPSLLSSLILFSLPGVSPPFILSLLVLWLAPDSTAPRGGSTADEPQPDDVALIIALVAAIAALAAVAAAAPSHAQQTLRNMLQQLEELRAGLAAVLVSSSSPAAEGLAPTAQASVASSDAVPPRARRGWSRARPAYPSPPPSCGLPPSSTRPPGLQGGTSIGELLWGHGVGMEEHVA